MPEHDWESVSVGAQNSILQPRLRPAVDSLLALVESQMKAQPFNGQSGTLWILYWQLRREFVEVASLLDMLAEELLVNKHTSDVLFDWDDSRFPGGVIDATTQQGRMILANVPRHMRAQARAAALVKAALEWLYHARNLIASAGAVRARVTDSSWERLQALCDLRNVRLTHTQDTEVIVLGGAKLVI